MIMLNIGDFGISRQAAGWGRRLWDIRAAIADYESGDDRGGIITPYMYSTLQTALEDCESIFGYLEMP